MTRYGAAATMARRRRRGVLSSSQTSAATSSGSVAAISFENSAPAKQATDAARQGQVLTASRVLRWARKDASTKTAQARSVRPEIQATDSTCTGCTANSAAPARAALLARPSETAIRYTIQQHRKWSRRFVTL